MLLIHKCKITSMCCFILLPTWCMVISYIAYKSNSFFDKLNPSALLSFLKSNPLTDFQCLWGFHSIPILQSWLIRQMLPRSVMMWLTYAISSTLEVMVLAQSTEQPFLAWYWCLRVITVLDSISLKHRKGGWPELAKVKRRIIKGNRSKHFFS